MKISFVSNVVLNLIVQKVKKKIDFEPNIQFGDVISILNNTEDFKNDDFVIIHLDTIFQKNGQEYLKYIVNAIETFSAQINGQVLVSTIFDPFPTTDLKNSSSQFAIFPPFLNLKHSTNIYELDFLKLLVNIGLTEAYNYNSGYLYQMPYKKQMIEALVEEFYGMITFLSQPEKKVIITDADNTLWGGILGEDGIENIKVSQNADGVLFLEYQKFLKQKKEEGFLLAICSKNNFEDVKLAFETIKMPLTFDDFICKKINWEPKFLNIKEIAKELNLGEASFIFIDDNKFEIDAVRSMEANRIECFEFVHDFNAFNALTEQYVFKRRQILEDDKVKHQKYIEEQKRIELKDSTGDFASYLNSLEIVNHLNVNDEKNIERISQLTSKTNQFNFNKIAFSEIQILDFIKQNGFVLSYSSSDKFGDYGIIGLAFVEIKNQKAELKNLLMSCRALGKGIEDSFYNEIVDFVKLKNANLIKIEFNRSEKNQLAESYLENLKTNNYNGREYSKITRNI